MRNLLRAGLFVFLTGLAAAQGFECQSIGPVPFGCCDDCEDLWSNNYGPDTGIRSLPICGMPAAGNQYARVSANAPYVSGPVLPRPIPFLVSEIRILVPDGADGVSFHWNWFNAEVNATLVDGGAGGFNDGFEVCIVAPDETTVLVPLVYVDTFSPLALGGCTDPISGGVDVLSDGAELKEMAFAPLPFGSYLSIVSFNGGDTQYPSSGAIDCLAWGDPIQPSYERGNAAGPRIVDLTPNTSFRIGQPTTVQLQAGNAFVEGFHCCIGQVYDLSSLPQFFVPGIAGGLFIRLNRPSFVVSEGMLAGGILAGTAGKGPQVQLLVNDPAVCGVGILIQGYVITEQLTNPTFTTALFGWFR